MDLNDAIAELFAAAKELAEYASYAEIVGGVSVNRPQVRKWCDAVFAARKLFPEDENYERHVPAVIPLETCNAVEALRMERDRFESALSRACLVGGTTYLVERAEKAEAEAEAAETALAAMTAREGVLRAFIDDFATAKIDALRYQPSYGESPEDEPDPVVDATEVWAWQSDAKDILALKETPDA